MVVLVLFWALDFLKGTILMTGKYLELILTIYTYKGRTLASVLCSVYAPNIKTIYGNIPDVDKRTIEPNRSNLCSIGSVIEYSGCQRLF